MAKILIVEDNREIIKALSYSLIQKQYEVDCAVNKEDANDKILDNQYDLIILDLTLPDGSGLDICKNLKNKNFASKNEDTPVLFLTANDTDANMIAAFDFGAEDYVLKPFRTNVLISRIENILRRHNKGKNEYEYENIVLNSLQMTVYEGDKEISLTALEYKILLFLFENKGNIVTRDRLLDKIYDVAGNIVNDNTLTVYIRRIRNKFENQDFIKTIKGIGYKID